MSSDLARLHKALLRLAIAHYGENTELDQQLTALSNTIRNPERRNGLPKMIEDVVATIVGLDASARKSAGNPAATAVARLMQALADALQWEDGGETPWGAIRHQLQANPSSNRLNVILDDCTRLIGTRVRDSAPASSGDGQFGPLKQGVERLLDTAGLVPGIDSAYALLRERIRTATSQMELLKALEEASAQLESAVAALAASPGPDAGAAVQLGRTALLGLLDKLNFPARSESHIGEIRALLAEDCGPDQISGAVARLSDLIRRTLAQARQDVRELSAFLKQVMTGLQDVRQEMLTLGHMRSDSLRDSESLQEAVDQRMQQVHRSVDEASDLEDLKISVSGHLEAFRTDVSSFIESERQRHREAEAAVSKLSGQLQSLAGETLRLRDDIQQERQRAVSDPLTGLANRLGLEEKIGYEVALWRREAHPLTIIIFDIDLFKCINDQFGHQAGDRVLKTVADQLRSQIRQTDFLARYGGEEFLMILPRTQLADACQLANKLRHHIETCKFLYRDRQVPVTLSCGVAEFHQGDTPESVFERADQALYIAKNEGRNRCFTEDDVACPSKGPGTNHITEVVVQ